MNADASVFDFPDGGDGDDGENNPRQTNAKRKQLSRTRKKPPIEKEENKENNLVSSPLRPSESKRVGGSMCLLCRHQFPDDESRSLHIPHCSGLMSSEKENMMAADEEILIVCPICNKQFEAGESASAKEIHVNKCLDISTMEIPEQEKTDELLARTLQYEEEKSSPADQFCLICHKDIGKYTVTQRDKHINNCMDKTEKIEGKNKRTNPSRKAKATESKRPSKVPKKPCPICKLEQPESVSCYFKVYFQIFCGG